MLVNCSHSSCDHRCHTSMMINRVGPPRELSVMAPNRLAFSPAPSLIGGSFILNHTQWMEERDVGCSTYRRAARLPYYRVRSGWKPSYTRRSVPLQGIRRSEGYRSDHDTYRPLPRASSSGIHVMGDPQGTAEGNKSKWYYSRMRMF